MGTRAKAVREKLMNICQERPRVALPRKFINQRYAEGGNAHTHFEKIVHMHESSLSRCGGQNQYVDLLLASIPSSHHPAVRKKGWDKRGRRPRAEVRRLEGKEKRRSHRH